MSIKYFVFDECGELGSSNLDFIETLEGIYDSVDGVTVHYDKNPDENMSYGTVIIDSRSGTVVERWFMEDPGGIIVVEGFFVIPRATLGNLITTTIGRVF